MTAAETGGRKKKITVEECWSLDAAKLARQGVFARPGNWGVALTWTNSFGEQVLWVPYWLENSPRGVFLNLRVGLRGGETVDEKILLQTTQPHFGGLRWWFACSLHNQSVECGRRVRKLYRPPRAWYFGCSHCLDLPYTSVQEHDKRVDYLVKHFYPHTRSDRKQESSQVLIGAEGVWENLWVVVIF